MVCAYVCLCRHGGAGFHSLKPRQKDWYNTNRVEVLRLLLVCLSETLYTKPDPLSPVRGRQGGGGHTKSQRVARRSHTGVPWYHTSGTQPQARTALRPCNWIAPIVSETQAQMNATHHGLVSSTALAVLSA